ncbi:MAG: methylated-DNA--[protein]-cysteine S-methyltransferase [Sphingobacteriales bacterium]|nr:MAG: methylated-DNA--[protein]-cysteine S-methyltransferase [Sphingobacteriales bacterium]
MQSLLFTSPVPEPVGPQHWKLTCDAREAMVQVKQLFYSRLETSFGTIWVCSTPQGICGLHFTDAVSEALLQTEVHTNHPQATFIERTEPSHLVAAALISGTGTALPALHLFGTPFQLRVWQALLHIPSGTTISYGDLASRLQLSKAASRAVGTAVGHNPVAVLVPCHRVVGSSGKLTGFRWGLARKRALLQAELQPL